MTVRLELDADLARVIDQNRIFIEDTPTAVLRRLLKIDKTPGGWFAQGVFLPNGTKIRMAYGEDPALTGEIRNGAWYIRGRKYASPSTAATAFVARGRGRRKTRVNGWLYWHVCPPGRAEWVLIDALRITAARPAKTGHNVTAFKRRATA